MNAAKEAINKHSSGDVDYNTALARLADAMARLKVVEIARNRR